VDCAYPAGDSLIRGGEQRVRLDTITLDLYPADDAGEIDKLGVRVSATAQHYGKRVDVGEIGLQTCKTCWTEQDQATYLPKAIASLKNAQPGVVLLYQVRDQSTDSTNGEATFGIRHYDGSPKVAYDDVIAAMH